MQWTWASNTWLASDGACKYPETYLIYVYLFTTITIITSERFTMGRMLYPCSFPFPSHTENVETSQTVDMLHRSVLGRIHCRPVMAYKALR